MRIYFFTAILVVWPVGAVADVIAFSEGTEVVNVRTSRFLPATATGGWCVSAQLGGVVGGYGASPAGGPATPCRSVFFIKDEARSAQSIFFNYYNRRTFSGKGPPAPIAKFPAPVTEFGET